MSGREKDLFEAAAGGRIGRREFARKLTALGITAAAAQTMLLGAAEPARRHRLVRQARRSSGRSRGASR